MPKRYSSSDLIKLLKKNGWYEVSCKGSHHKFKHKDKKNPVIVPHPQKEIPVGTAEQILKDAGLK